MAEVEGVVEESDAQRGEGEVGRADAAVRDEARGGGEGEEVLLAKVDVEGAELDVLEALGPLLARISNLELELAPRRAGELQDASAALQALKNMHNANGTAARVGSDDAVLRTPLQTSKILEISLQDAKLLWAKGLHDAAAVSYTHLTLPTKA